MEAIKFKTVSEYFSSFPPATRKILRELRQTIKDAAPDAEESISYNMPAFKYYGPFVYYAAYKNHIGFYPTPDPIAAFKKELAKYKQAKGSVQFPIDEPLPLSLITKMVKYRAKQNKEKQLLKNKSLLE